MKQLPEIHLKSPSTQQKERFARWLAEWELDCNLSYINDNPVNTGVTTVDLPVSDVADELPVAVGQIRLLSPSLPVARNRLIYVAVLDCTSSDSFLVAPFGRFAEPAFSGELLMKGKSQRLKVLCLWNAFSVCAGKLAASWVVDDLSSKEMEYAMSVFRHLREGAVLPKSVLHRVGPPLWHPADPRFEYQREEAFIRHGLSENSGDSFAPLWVDKTGASPQLKAAESRAEYRTKLRPGLHFADKNNTPSENNQKK